MSRNEFDLREPHAAEGRAMVELMRRGVIEALREHKSEGRSVIAWDRESRQIVELLPEEIVLPDEVVENGSD